MPKASSNSSSPFSSSPTPSNKMSADHHFSFEVKTNGMNGQETASKISDLEAQNGSSEVVEEEK